MKTKINTIKMNFKFGIFSLIIAIGLFATSCVGDDDFRVPSTEGEPAEIDGEIISIGAVINMIDQGEGASPETLTFLEDTFVEGYVTSSDQAGNFFRELIIQDKPENPTAGIRISVDINPLFGTYEPGRKVYLKLDGLTIGRARSIPTIGILGANNRVERIQEAQARRILIRDNVVEQIVPKVVSFSEFNTSLLCQAIRVENVQFPSSLVVENDKFRRRTYGPV